MPDSPRSHAPAVRLRPATREDAGAINDLYNHYVHHSDCTLQIEPTTLAQRQAWFDAQGGLPVLIAELEGEIVGWGALVKFNPREGYRFTLEDSIYLRHDRQGRGVGRVLLGALMEQAKALGAHRVIAKITAAQHPSLKLHQAMGFVEVGRLTEVGFKFDRWVDVVFLEARL